MTFCIDGLFCLFVNPTNLGDLAVFYGDIGAIPHDAFFADLGRNPVIDLLAVRLDDVVYRDGKALGGKVRGDLRPESALCTRQHHHPVSL